jgi:hypothetical protein
MKARLQGTEANLKAYYSFEDGAASDMSGNNHHGVLVGDTTTSYRGLNVVSINAQGGYAYSGVLPAAGGTAAYSVVAEPTLGRVEIDNDGVFIYTPNDSNMTGTDSFSYAVLDSQGNYSYSEVVKITLN